MTSGPPVDQFDMNPEAVHARFEWAARQGDPKWLWPATTVTGWRAALTAIGQATRIVLNEGRAATLEGDDEPILLADFVDLHDAAMDECRGRPRFVMEAAHISGVTSKFRVQNFQSDLAAQRNLLREIDFGHRSAPQPAEHEEVFQSFTDEIGHEC